LVKRISCSYILKSNIAYAPNPTSAEMLINNLQRALETNDSSLMPCFFRTLESPSVEEYKKEQRFFAEIANGRGESRVESETTRPSLYRRDSTISLSNISSPHENKSVRSAMEIQQILSSLG